MRDGFLSVGTPEKSISPPGLDQKIFGHRKTLRYQMKLYRERIRQLLPRHDERTRTDL
jgi:hypothetical protein